MKRARLLIPGLVSILGAALAAPLSAGGIDGVVYELREGSFLVDGCGPCMRPILQLPLRGSFTLVPASEATSSSTITT